MEVNNMSIPANTLAWDITNRDADGFERIVGGEVIIPNQMCVYGDFYTEEQVKRFAYAFMIAGINLGFKSGANNSGVGLDVEHGEVDRTGEYYVVESFIATEAHPQFTKGAWVVYCWIRSDELWQDILDGTLAGFSFQAETLGTDVMIEGDFDQVAVGRTEEDPFDGHTHAYVCTLDETGRVVEGSTTEVNGHTHKILKHSVTEEAYLHRHRFNLTKSE